MEHTEQASEAKLQALYRLGQQLILLRDERAIAQTVLAIAEDVLEFGDSEFLLVDESSQELFVYAHRGDLDVARDLRLPLGGNEGVTVAAAHRGEPVYVPRVSEEPRYVSAGFDAGSELAVPVQAEGRVLGVINVESRRPDAYTPADARLLSTLASQAALALQNARHHAQERRRAEQMAVINRIARRISATLDLRDTLDTIVEAAYELVPCVLAEISLWDGGRQMLTLQALRCEPERAFPLGKSYPPGEGYTGWLVRHREPLLVPDVDAQEDIHPDLLPGERPFKAYLGVPLIAGDELIGTLVLIHDQAEAFDAANLALLEGLGAQAAVAIRNARLYEELARRHRESTALFSVAAAANRPLGLQELLERALDHVIDVTNAGGGAIRLLDPDKHEVVLAAHHGLSARYVEKTARFALSEQIVGAVARSGAPALSEDMQADARISPETGNLLEEEGYRSLAQVPLRAQEEVVGTLAVVASERGFFDERDLNLLSAIGDQLGVAIAKAQLFAETERRSRELAALNAVAAATSRALGLDALLADAVTRVVECIEANGGGIRLLDPTTGELTLSITEGISEAYIDKVRNLRLGQGIVGDVALTGEPALLADMREDPRVPSEVVTPLKEEGIRSFAVVPLRSQKEVVGTLGVVSHTPGTFGRADVRLLTAMGYQIGVAITNAQLFEETKRKARKLAALNAVASVINQPLTLQEIMDQAVAKVGEVMEVQAVSMRLLDRDTGELPIVSYQGLSLDYVQAEDRIGPQSEDPVERVARRGEPVVVQDLAQDTSAATLDVTTDEFRAFAIVPMRSKDEIVGTLGVATRTRREFDPEEVDLLTAIGHQIGVAVENARLYADLAQRASELEAVQAVAAAVNRPGHLDKILDEGLNQALAVTGLEMGAIFVRDQQTNLLCLSCHQGMSENFVVWLQERVREKSPEIWRLVEAWSEERQIDIEEIPPDGAPLSEPLQDEAIRMTADVPLFAEGEVVGVLTVATRALHVFASEERSLLQAIGHQLGTAIANAQLRQGVIDAERLAAVGRVAASVAHELRSPLGAVMRSAEFLARPELSEPTRRKLSSAIVAMARRLINTSQELLDYARGGRMALRRASCSLPDFLDEVLEVLRVDFSDRGIAVERDWGYRGRIRMDADRMAQVVYNIAANARDAMPRGGQLTVATERSGDWVELRFTDTGPGVPAELQERIFEPFVSYGKQEGAGLGLAIAQRIVQEHGGEIEVESPDTDGATFTVRLPLG